MDIITLEQHFRENLEPCYDRDAGEGFEVQVDRGDKRRPLTLQVFPDSRIARIRTPLTDVTLRQAQVVPLEESGDALWLTGRTDEEWTRVMLRQDGSMVLASFPNREVDIEQALRGNRAQERRERPAAPGLSEGSLRDEEEVPERVVYDTSGAIVDAATPLSHDAKDAPNRIEQEKITVAGRVGTEPRFRTTKNDKLVCSFPVAEHDESGKTTWHSVVVFGERALKLQDSLEKGQEVEVIGYVHVNQAQGKDGQPKEKQEIWAAVVRKPKPST